MNLRKLAAVGAALIGIGGFVGVLIGYATQLSGTTYSHPTLIGLLVGLASGTIIATIMAPLVSIE